LSAPLLVTEDGLSIPVAHGPSALFDLVYLLSDKNERGMMSPHGMDDNYEIIAHISLLKNRVRPATDTATGHGGYNNMTFKSGIRGSSGRQGYASAGFSAVRRPNRQIALAVLYHAFHYLAAKLQEGGALSLRERQARRGLSADSLRERAAALLPDEAGLEEMTGLMSHGRPSYSELKPLSLREAETLLFGDGGQAYFRSNFAEVSARRVADTDAAREWAAVLAAQEKAVPPLTFYQLAEWTAEQPGSGSVLHALRQHMAGLRAAIASAQEELEQLYAESVERQPFQRVPLLDKRTVRNFIHYLFAQVYSRKYELLRMESELALCLRYDAALEQLHAESKAKVQTMEAMEEELHSVALASIGRTSETVDQNIMEYYRNVTEEVMRDIEARRGPGIFFSDRFLGSVSERPRQGGAVVAERLIELGRRELLAAEAVALPVGEELRRRAHGAAAYEHREIVWREGLLRGHY
ncbi:transcription initiation factor TFIID, partial [Paenibacillus riograndensis]